jgi:hypothetical protein
MKGLEFYSAAAQIIPLLSLLLLVEVRASTLGRRVYALPFVVPGLLFLQFAAELYLLAVLKTESDPGSIAYWFTFAVLSLTGVFVGVFMAIYVASARVLEREES